MKRALEQFQKKSQRTSEDKKLEVLSSAYEQTMERISRQQPGFQLLAKRVLLWITCAKRPLTTSELQCALAVEVDEVELDEENLAEIQIIVEVCAGLVTVDKDSSIIRLVHYTTQEYFERTQYKLSLNAESEVATSCVTYLSFDAFESGPCQTDDEFEKRLQLYKLYDYASHYWAHHARIASTIAPGVISFLKRNAQVEASVQGLLAVKEYSQYFPRQMTGLHLAASLGVKPAVQLLLEEGTNMEAADQDGWTPLRGASRNGHVEVVRLLLEKGADVDAADKVGRASLYEASQCGHIEVVRLLLEKGAKVKVASQDGWAPLHGASAHNHIEIVKLLLEKGADINQGRGTPLYRASQFGHIEVVRLLLQKGANVEAADGNGETPLYRASVNGYIDIVSLLLEEGADVEAANEDGDTPLYMASERGHEAVAKLLLEKGAKLETNRLN